MICGRCGGEVCGGVREGGGLWGRGVRGVGGVGRSD